jgi:hypothetical protein
MVQCGPVQRHQLARELALARQCIACARGAAAEDALGVWMRTPDAPVIIQLGAWREVPVLAHLMTASNDIVSAEPRKTAGDEAFRVEAYLVFLPVRTAP